MSFIYFSNFNYPLIIFKLVIPRKRFHVFDANSFAHLGNPSYIVKEWYEPFNRYIVRLKQVWWLEYWMELPSIGPGKHHLEIHIRLDKDNFSWGGSEPAKLEIRKYQSVIGKKPDFEEGDLLTQYELNPADLGIVAQGQNQDFFKKHRFLASRQSNGESGWYLLKLNPFVLQEETNLAFRWKATDSSLKCGICWDYMDVVQKG